MFEVTEEARRYMSHSRGISGEPVAQTYRHQHLFSGDYVDAPLQIAMDQTYVAEDEEMADL